MMVTVKGICSRFNSIGEEIHFNVIWASSNYQSDEMFNFQNVKNFRPLKSSILLQIMWYCPLYQLIFKVNNVSDFAISECHSALFKNNCE